LLAAGRGLGARKAPGRSDGHGCERDCPPKRLSGPPHATHPPSS
jgi:hypothetical protein